MYVIAAVACLVSVIIWAALASPFYIACFCAWTLRWAGSSVVRAAVLAVAVQAIGILLFLACLIGAMTLSDTFGGRWLMAVLLVPSALAMAPLFYAFIPDPTNSPYRRIRWTLIKEGATPEQARAMAWSAGVLACIGAGYPTVTLVIPFLG